MELIWQGHYLNRQEIPLLKNTSCNVIGKSTQLLFILVIPYNILYLIYLLTHLVSVLPFPVLILFVSSMRTGAFSVFISALYVKWLTDFLNEWINTLLLLCKKIYDFRKHPLNIIVSVENTSLGDVCLGQQIENVCSCYHI